MNVAAIVEQAKTLSAQERKLLVKLLIDTLDVAESPPVARRLSELRGLGKDLWHGVDAQRYVDQQRDEWERQP